MQLEDYFDFLAPNDIRVRGTRVGIETVLRDYLRGATAEEIAFRYRSLTVEQVYATITYYWHNQQEVEAYIEACSNQVAEARRRYYASPPAEVQRLIEARRRMQQREVANQP
jgi:uncharacterized protein (DUF433 family)